jgi:phosphatidylglycerol---prolipoprotein diacylglyceryl transferase
MFELAIPFPDISPFLFEIPSFQLGGFTIGPLGLRWYALGYIVGLVLAWRLMLKLAGRPGDWGGKAPFSRDDVDDFLFYATLGVLLGGRIGYVILYRPEMLAEPASLLRIWEGGMSFHGGFTGVCLAVLGTAWGRKISLLALSDAVAVSAGMGIFLVRIANFINQELWGRVTDVSWAFIFKTDPLQLPRHPSQLYQAFLEGFLTFVITRIAVAKFGALTRPGLTTGLFLCVYGVGRMIGEMFREPDAGLLFGLTRGTFYSIPIVAAGLGFLLFAMIRPAKAVEITPPALSPADTPDDAPRTQ